MRAAAPIQVALTRFGAWRLAIAVLTFAIWLVIGLWLTQTVPAPSAAVNLAGGTLAVAVAVSGWSLQRVPPTSLRWDGAAWHLGSLATAGEEPDSGEVEVAVDLGSWLLLRFVRDHNTLRPRSTVWLPIQRRGLEPQWHALRCAIYSPRPPRGHDTSADL